MRKKELFLVGEFLNTRSGTVSLGWELGSFLTTYLGLLLWIAYKSKAIWDPVVERLETREEISGMEKLVSLKRKKTDLGTRSSLPMNFLSILLVLTSIQKTLDNMITSCLTS